MLQLAPNLSSQKAPDHATSHHCSSARDPPAHKVRASLPWEEAVGAGQAVVKSARSGSQEHRGLELVPPLAEAGK